MVGKHRQHRGWRLWHACESINIWPAGDKYGRDEELRGWLVRPLPYFVCMSTLQCNIGAIVCLGCEQRKKLTWRCQQRLDEVRVLRAAANQNTHVTVAYVRRRNRRPSHTSTISENHLFLSQLRFIMANDMKPTYLQSLLVGFLFTPHNSLLLC